MNFDPSCWFQFYLQCYYGGCQDVLRYKTDFSNLVNGINYLNDYYYYYFTVDISKTIKKNTNKT